MRVLKPTVEYKLFLQKNPRWSFEDKSPKGTHQNEDKIELVEEEHESEDEENESSSDESEDEEPRIKAQVTQSLW